MNSGQRISQVIAGIAATALLAACSASPSEAEKQAIMEEFAALSSADMVPSEAFSELTWQIFDQLAAQSLLTPEQMTGWTDEAEVKAVIAQRYAPYAADIDAAILDELRQRLSDEQIAMLGTIDDDPGKLDTAQCSANSQALDWPAKWTGCEGEGATPLAAEEKAAYESFVAALTAAMGSDAALAYWGGTTCGLLDDFASDVSNDTFEFGFQDVELHLGDAEAQPCARLTQMLADRRAGAGD